MVKIIPDSWSISLRSKFILCLLFSSLAAVLLVGWVANYELVRRFDEATQREASERYQREVVAYIRAYHDWHQGQQHESLDSFAERNAAVIHHEPIPFGDPGYLTLHDDRISHQRSIPVKPRLFQFHLFDTRFRALTDFPPYQKGQLASDQDVVRMHAILHKEVPVAYFVPQGRANYSEQEVAYLAAVQHAIRMGVYSALALTLILGILLGNRLSTGLRKLIDATQQLGTTDAAGEFRFDQHVDIRGHDEVSTLARAFNHMRERIASTTAALTASHAHIAAQAEQLRHLSERDGLTALYNRRYFDEQGGQLFRQAVQSQQALSVMIADIDYFKQINDRHSHAVGDAVLRKVGEILAGHVRQGDLVARYGGEEFVIAFPQTPLADAATCCEALRQRIEQYPWHTLDANLKVTISMGLTDDLRTQDLHAMLNQADSMLYAAKHQGRNRLCLAQNADASHTAHPRQT